MCVYAFTLHVSDKMRIQDLKEFDKLSEGDELSKGLKSAKQACVVLGHIGAGKSQFIQFLRDVIGEWDAATGERIGYVLEETADWEKQQLDTGMSFLEMTEKPERNFGFNFQALALLSMTERTARALRNQDSVVYVQERGIDDSRAVFARSLGEEGRLSREQGLTYLKMIELVRSTIPFPEETLYVYINTPREECDEGTARRGRDGEQSDDVEEKATRAAKWQYLDEYVQGLDPARVVVVTRDQESIMAGAAAVYEWAKVGIANSVSGYRTASVQQKPHHIIPPEARVVDPRTVQQVRASELAREEAVDRCFSHRGRGIPRRGFLYGAKGDGYLAVDGESLEEVYLPPSMRSSQLSREEITALLQASQPHSSTTWLRNVSTPVKEVVPNSTAPKAGLTSAWFASLPKRSSQKASDTAGASKKEVEQQVKAPSGLDIAAEKQKKRAEAMAALQQRNQVGATGSSFSGTQTAKSAANVVTVASSGPPLDATVSGRGFMSSNMPPFSSDDYGWIQGTRSVAQPIDPIQTSAKGQVVGVADDSASVGRKRKSIVTSRYADSFVSTGDTSSPRVAEVENRNQQAPVLLEGQRVVWTAKDIGVHEFSVGPSKLIVYCATRKKWGQFLSGVFALSTIAKGTCLPPAQGTVISKELGLNLIMNGQGAHLSCISKTTMLNGGPGAGPIETDIIANLNSSENAYWPAVSSSAIPKEGVDAVDPSWMKAVANVSLPQPNSAAFTVHAKASTEILVNQLLGSKELLADYDVRPGCIVGPKLKVLAVLASLEGATIQSPVLGCPLVAVSGALINNLLGEGNGSDAVATNGLMNPDREVLLSGRGRQDDFGGAEDQNSLIGSSSDEEDSIDA